MNPYAALAARVNTSEALSLSSRLSAWHDAMVMHERRLRGLPGSAVCGDECPHTEALELWQDALHAFGTVAEELTFLRSRAEAAVDDVLADSFPASDPPSWNSARARPRASRVEAPDQAFTSKDASSM